MIRKFLLSLSLVFAVQLTLGVPAAVADTLDDLLAETQKARQAEAEENKKREAEFLASRDRQKAMHDEAQATWNAAKARSDPDVWSVVGRTELQVLQAVATGRLAGAQSRLAAEFADLQRSVSAPTEWRSVYDTARFVLERYARHAAAAEQRACSELLAQLAGYGWPDGA